MDSLFHFDTPNIKPYKKKNLSLVPTSFIKNQAAQEEEDKEEPISPMIFQKKSHFSFEKSQNFTIKLNNNEEDDSNANTDDVPISPISKIDENCFFY